MANMGYCRFTNTRQDLQECLEAIQYDARLSDVETRAGKAMFEEFLTFCKEQGIIDDFDEETLAALFRYLEMKEDTDDA